MHSFSLCLLMKLQLCMWKRIDGHASGCPSFLVFLIRPQQTCWFCFFCCVELCKTEISCSRGCVFAGTFFLILLPLVCLRHRSCSVWSSLRLVCSCFGVPVTDLACPSTSVASALACGHCRLRGTSLSSCRQSLPIAIVEFLP